MDVRDAELNGQGGFMGCMSEKLTHRYEKRSRRFPSPRGRIGDPGPCGAAEERLQAEVEIAGEMKRANMLGDSIRQHSPGKT